MTKTFKVEIEEVSTRVIEVEADTVDEARDKVENAYDLGEVVLDTGDFWDKTFTVLPEDCEYEADQKI